MEAGRRRLEVAFDYNNYIHHIIRFPLKREKSYETLDFINCVRFLQNDKVHGYTKHSICYSAGGPIIWIKKGFNLKLNPLYY